MSDDLLAKVVQSRSELRAAARAYLRATDVDGHDDCGCTRCLYREHLEEMLL